MKRSGDLKALRFAIWGITRDRINDEVKLSMATFVRTSSYLVMGLFGGVDMRYDVGVGGSNPHI